MSHLIYYLVPNKIPGCAVFVDLKTKLCFEILLIKILYSCKSPVLVNIYLGERENFLENTGR